MKPLSRLWISAFFSCFFLQAASQAGYRYAGAYGGDYYQHSYFGGLFLDIAREDHGAYSFFVEGRRYHRSLPVLSKETTEVREEHYAILGGVAYKKILLRRKNNSFRFLLAATAGTTAGTFVVGPQAGLEFTHSFAGGWELLLQPRGGYLFRAPGKNGYAGLGAGIRLPVN
ncbi:hypothetical protein V9K67_23930 [Paraflavisolibacter sp. H34]|uniref:hypothetical protein n=1 Tax=Huijunlia imazamoxiresistens TaxID=3127457 RepID=UPI003015BACE